MVPPGDRGGHAVEPQGAVDPARTAPTAAAAIDETDPHKGRFGGKAESNSWKLSATVEPEMTRSLYEVRLVVQSSRAPAPSGEVVFHLHPTFPHPVKNVALKEGKAKLKLLAYGAFTVGAECDGGQTRLELDLSEGDYPQAFREA
jgi:hypothetical protein